ncbi:MAG: bacterial Ig-like domain-containing protein [Prevotella sp.]|nr:bacterial Ig-like domain-containing protein [Prevotella sp.]
MKKLLTRMMLLLCALMAGSSSVWATDVIFSEDFSQFTKSSTNALTSLTSGDYGSWSDVANVYPEVGYIKFSSSSKKGKMTTPALSSLNGDATLTFKIGKYSSKTGTLKITINNAGTFEDEATTKTISTSSLDQNGWDDANSIKISNGKATTTITFESTAERFYLDDIKVVSDAVVIKTDPTITFNDGSVRVGKTLDLSTLFTSNSEGTVTYSITDGGSYASIDGDKLTGVAEGNVTVEASQAAVGTYNAKTASATITINAALTLGSIAITTAPTKTTYTEGDTFDATGMVVTATYTNASTDNVTDACVITPSGALSTNDTEVTVSYTENGVTKTAKQAITVNERTQETSVSISLNNTLFSVSVGNNATEQSTTVDGVTITTGCTSSASTKTYYDTSHIRFYANSYLKLAAPTGYVITGITLNRYSSGNWNPDKVTASEEGFVDGETEPLKWAGQASEITFNYSGQCRTESVDITLAKIVNITIGTAGYATFSNANEVAIPEGMTAYYAQKKNETTITLKEIDGGYIPANTGVVVAGTTKTYATIATATSATLSGTNLLQPWLTAGTPAADTYYTLAVEDEKPVFKLSTGGTLAAGKAYLVMPAGARQLTVEFGETTGISTTMMNNGQMNNEVYNLAGQRVTQPTKGLYIVNGKKVIIK